MKKYYSILFISVIIISLLGLLMIYSSSSIWAEYKFNDAYKYLKTQSLFLFIGYFIMIIISKIDYYNYKRYSSLILITCFSLLILVLIPGIGTVRNGSRSWFGIGSFGIQPSEFSKLGLIIFTSKYFSDNKFKKNFIPILIIIFLFFGLIMMQPDFGTAFIIIVTVIAMMFVAGINMRFFIRMGIIGFLGIVVLIIIAPYRVKRITSFLNPWSDPLGSGFQIIQSLYAIGPGGLLGMGFGNSVQKHFYLPEPQTDFIFSIISEELGFVGILIIAALFLSIIYCGLSISLNHDDNFAKYLSFGIIFGIAFQAILNLSVVIGLVPVTG